MYLSGLQPGASVDEAREKTGWTLRVAKGAAGVKPPTPGETKLLRSPDQRRIYLR